MFCKIDFCKMCTNDQKIIRLTKNNIEFSNPRQC